MNVRPVYERDEDISRQAMVALVLETKWGLSLLPMAKLSGVDFLAHKRGTTIFKLIEIKCRTNGSKRYPTLILSKLKTDLASQAAMTLGMEFILVVQWLDGVFYRQITPGDLAITAIDHEAGRRDRGDSHDVESCYAFNVETFRRIADAQS